MSRLTELLRAAKQIDPRLGEDLEAEIRPLQKRLPFGLNFERHAPEAVELAGHKVRKGSKVRVLPPRGSTERGDQRLWRVDAITGDTARVSLLGGSSDETETFALDDLGPPPSFGPVAVRVVGFRLMGALPSVVDGCEVAER